MSLNWPKLIGLIAGMVAVTVLMLTHAVDQEAGVPLLTLLIGYVVGNGIAGKSGVPAPPVIGPKQQKEDESA